MLQAGSARLDISPGKNCTLFVYDHAAWRRATAKR